MRSRRRRLLAGIGLLGLMVLLTAGVALAQGEQLGGKLLTGNEVTIAAGQTVDHDVYVFGGTVVSNGTINGDLTVAGGYVTVNGTVNGDVLVAGGNVTLDGPVKGDVRIAGGNITIDGDVTEDVAVVGGRVTVAGHVGQDLLVSVGDLTLSGTVAGSTIGNAGTYQKSGTITGTDGITVGRQSAPVRPPSNPVLDAVRQFLAVLLVAALALWLVPRVFTAAEARVREQPLPSFGWGFVGVIGYFVAVIVVAVVAILLAIVLGVLGFGALLGVDLLGAFASIAGLSLVFIIVAAFLSDAIVGLALARLVAGRTGSVSSLTPGMRGPWADLGLLAVGAAAVVILTSLPIVGWIAKLVVVFLGLGALWLAWRPGRLAPAGPLPTPPPPPTLPTA